MRKILLVVAILCGFSLFAQTNFSVDVTSNIYTPMVVTITVGDTVTWTNLQGVHNVNGNQATYPNNPESFGNGNAAPPGWVFQHVFNTPGTYDYQCDPHLALGMVGQVIVEEAAANGNVVITEIMYNPPESGQDSLEFIELFNAGPGVADLNGWSVTEGVDIADFGDVTMQEGEYLILAGNAAAFNNNFNFAGQVIEWEGGALTNGGEDIEITDNNGSVVDFVLYDDEPLWPLGTDGEGASIILCDVDADNNDPLNWQASTNSTGVIIGGVEVLASPGAANSCGVPTPTVFWVDATFFEDEDAGQLSVRFVRQNIGMAGEVAEVSLGGGTTATVLDDYTTLPPLPNIYGANGPITIDTVELFVTIVDDADIENEEVIELSLAGLNGTTVAGNPNLTITIFDNDSEVVVTPIADIQDVDADGVSLFIDSIRTIQGVTYCLDIDSDNGYRFYVVEPETNNGIFIFSSNDLDDYTFAEGDELQITGEIAQFRGLLQIRPQSIEVLSTGNSFVEPLEVMTLNEETERRYVELSISPDSPTEDNIFVFNNGSINATAVSQAGDTVTVRIEAVTGIDSTSLANFFAANSLSQQAIIRGIGSQFTSEFNPPYVGGYQILPCTVDDFRFVVNVNEPSWAADLKLYPNPVSQQLTVEMPIVAEQFRLLDGLGRVAQFGQVATDKLQLDMSQLPNGVYYLQILDGVNLVTRSIVKQ